MNDFNLHYEPEDLELANSLGLNFHGSIMPEEWAGLYRFTIDNNLTRIVEIGSYVHVSSLAFLMALKKLGKGLLVCIDPNFPNKNFKSDNPDVKLIKIEDYSENVLPILNQSFDLSFVDGNHGKFEVLQDINNSRKVVVPDGYIVMHDSNYRPTQRGMRMAFGAGHSVGTINLSPTVVKCKNGRLNGIAIYKNLPQSSL